MAERIFVAVAWPYTNGPRHLGHVAGFGVPSDVFARYHRFKGNDVLMVSGTDEHGTPNLIQADAEGLTPKQAVDKYSRIISEDLRSLGLSYDLFTRWIAEQSHWRPNVRNFSLNYIVNLKPRAITRDIDWGVPIPLSGWEDRPDKRMYVWFDAVIGYFSAAVEWAHMIGRPEAWRDWWQDPKSRHFYFMGKDNIVFHTTIWPAILLGYGNGGTIAGGRGEPLQLPYNVVSSEFLTMEGRRFSTSRGVVIHVNDFLSRYDPDALRFYLMLAGPETQDSDFTWADFVRRNNDELVATWGNLAHRTLVNAHRRFGQVPQPGRLTPDDEVLIETVESGFE